MGKKKARKVHKNKTLRLLGWLWFGEAGDREVIYLKKHIVTSDFTARCLHPSKGDEKYGEQGTFKDPQSTPHLLMFPITQLSF